MLLFRKNLELLLDAVRKEFLLSPLMNRFSLKQAAENFGFGFLWLELTRTSFYGTCQIKIEGSHLEDIKFKPSYPDISPLHPEIPCSTRQPSKGFPASLRRVVAATSKEVYTLLCVFPLPTPFFAPHLFWV